MVKIPLKLCRLIQDKRVIPCLQSVDIYKVKLALPNLEVWAQHADPFAPGKIYRLSIAV